MANYRFPRLLLAAVLLLSLPILLEAAPITMQKAQSIASKFMQQKGMTAQPSMTYRAPRANQSDNSYYYVFNAPGDKGFVIISGDDRTPQVLGYSDKGQLNIDALPENIRAFLQTYSDEIKHLDDANITVAQRAPVLKAEETTHAVYPLLTCTWNQDSPFNNNCPYVSSEQTVTGCVATAMSQVMYYHKWPAQTTAAIPSYTYKVGSTNQSKTISGESAGVTLDWADMVDHYYGSETSAQNSAVANLMSVVGKSVNMNYDIASYGGSGASGSAIAPALRNYFGYSATDLDRASCTLEEFESKLYDEVVAGRPVVFCGQSSGGGHCFVIDGYDGDGLFHVNWGWGGMSDGFFLISVLNPNNTSGIGASTTSDGYSASQSAVIGIEKASGTTTSEAVSMTVNNLSVSNDSLEFSVWNLTGDTHNFDIGFVLIGDDGNVSNSWTYFSTGDLDNYYGYNLGIKLSDICSALGISGAGTYRVAVASRENGTDDWIFSGSSTAVVTIDNNGNITASVPNDVSKLSVTNWEFTGTKSVGTAQPVNITITNTGGEFYGTVYLFASKTTSKGSYKALTGITIPANGYGVIQMSFTPTTSTGTGTYNVWLCTDNSGENVLGSSSVYISSATSTTENLSGSFNPSSGTVYGKTLKGTYTVTNNSSSAYNGSIIVAAFDADNNYTNMGQTSTTVSIDGNASTTLPFSFNLSAGNYLVALFATNQFAGVSLTLADGVVIYSADGTSTGQAATSTFTVPATATAVDFSGVESSVTTVNTANANPNTIYYFSKSCTAATTLAGNGKNVVIDGEADNLTIADGYDFFAPTMFTATSATYTRTPAIGTNGTGGWLTLCLPFEASSITVDGTAQHWFTSPDDTGKDLWLMEFSRLDNGKVVFGFNSGTTVGANIPYIIAVPDDHWGEQYSLVNKTLTFTGTNVRILSTANMPIISASSAYNFIGTTTQKSVANAFVINAEGTAFNSSATATASPFTNYFVAKTSEASNAKSLAIAIEGQDDSGTTGITAIVNGSKAAADSPLYNLAGQRVGKDYKGIVIQNGKKIKK